MGGIYPHISFMFVRIKRSGSGKQQHEYLQIVESRREGAAVRQRVIATLGRKDELVAGGTLDGLLASLARFNTRLRVVAQIRQEGLRAYTAHQWGPARIFGRLWEQQGLPTILG
ncbi:MAG: IS1634 family transposase, partial [Pseudomonadota bacterium]